MFRMVLIRHKQCNECRKPTTWVFVGVLLRWAFFTGYCLYFLCVHVSVCRQIYSVCSEFSISLAMLRMWKAGYSLIILIISTILMFLNSVRSLPMWKSVHFCTLGTHLPRSTFGCKEWFEFTDNKYAALTPQVETCSEGVAFLHFSLLMFQHTERQLNKGRKLHKRILAQSNSPHR